MHALSSVRAWILSHSVVSFYLLTFGLEFGLIGGLLALRLGIPNVVVNIFVYLPTAVAVLLSGTENGWKGIAGLLGKFLVWRVNIGWYLVALFGVPALGLLLRFAYSALGINIPDIMPTEQWLTPSILFQVAIGAALGEEAGWRGYVLPRLQSRMSALSAALIIGVLWGAIWHLPMFFGSFTVPFTWYILLVVAWSILFTWVYNNTRGSLLMAFLLHFSCNLFTGRLGLDSPQLFTSYVIVTWLVAIAVVVVYGPRRLVRGGDEQAHIDLGVTLPQTRA